MPEPDERLAETLLDSTVLDGVATQMIDPEGQRALRYRKHRRRNLSGAGPSRYAAIRKHCHHRPDIGVRVRIVQMVMGVPAVEQNGLLDQAQTQYRGEEVDILLRAACAQRDVMETFDDRVRHIHSSLTLRVDLWEVTPRRTRRTR